MEFREHAPPPSTQMSDPNWASQRRVHIDEDFDDACYARLMEELP